MSDSKNNLNSWQDPKNDLNLKQDLFAAIVKMGWQTHAKSIIRPTNSDGGDEQAKRAQPPFHLLSNFEKKLMFCVTVIEAIDFSQNTFQAVILATKKTALRDIRTKMCNLTRNMNLPHECVLLVNQSSLREQIPSRQIIIGKPSIIARLAGTGRIDTNNVIWVVFIEASTFTGSNLNVLEYLPENIHIFNASKQKSDGSKNTNDPYCTLKQFLETNPPNQKPYRPNKLKLDKQQLVKKEEIDSKEFIKKKKVNLKAIKIKKENLTDESIKNEPFDQIKTEPMDSHLKLEGDSDSENESFCDDQTIKSESVGINDIKLKTCVEKKNLKAIKIEKVHVADDSIKNEPFDQIKTEPMDSDVKLEGDSDSENESFCDEQTIKTEAVGINDI